MINQHLLIVSGGAGLAHTLGRSHNMAWPVTLLNVSTYGWQGSQCCGILPKAMARRVGHSKFEVIN